MTSASAHEAMISSSLPPRPSATAAPRWQAVRGHPAGPSSKTPMFTIRRRPSRIRSCPSRLVSARAAAVARPASGNIDEPRSAPQGGPGPIACAGDLECATITGSHRNDERAASSRVALGRLRGGGRGRHASSRFTRTPRPGSLAAAGQHRRQPAPPRAHRAADDPRRLARPRPRAGRAPRRRAVRPGQLGRRRSICWRGELRRVYDAHGGEAVYGGSYGWASAGRFHHAQSQLHRFLNCLGGYARGEHSYSNGAPTRDHAARAWATMRELLDRATAWSVIERAHRALRLLRRDPAQEHDGEPGRRQPASACATTCAGGRARAPSSCWSARCATTCPSSSSADGTPIAPGTDVAVMLGARAHRSSSEGLHDRAFLARYCAGFERFERYVLGAATAAEDAGVGRAALRDSGRRRSARWPGGWPRRAR